MASSPRNLDSLLQDWPYEPGEVAARRATGKGGRPLLQLRIDLGILQLEVEGRPDGIQPEGHSTYYDMLLDRALHAAGSFELTEEHCTEIDREFVQFYHRRVAWLALREFDLAVADADHTLALLDFSSTHAPDEDWVELHEQYRPFVLFHRTQARVLKNLETSDADSALAALGRGLARLQQALAELGVEEEIEQDDFVRKLVELRDSIRLEYGVSESLTELLAEAIASEKYELAAKLRDQIARR